MILMTKIRGVKESILSYSIDEIKDLYLYSDLTIPQMAEKYGVYVTSMEKFLRKIGLVKCRRPGRHT